MEAKDTGEKSGHFSCRTTTQGHVSDNLPSGLPAKTPVTSWATCERLRPRTVGGTSVGSDPTGVGWGWGRFLFCDFKWLRSAWRLLLSFAASAQSRSKQWLRKPRKVPQHSHIPVTGGVVVSLDLEGGPRAQEMS